MGHTAAEGRITAIETGTGNQGQVEGGFVREWCAGTAMTFAMRPAA